MNDTVVQFGQLGLVPAVGGTYEVAGDALKTVDARAATFRAGVQVVVGVLVAAVHTAVAVVVDSRSQFPSAKGKNFHFKYLGMWK